MSSYTKQKATRRRYSAFDIFEESFSSVFSDPIKEEEEVPETIIPVPFCKECTFFIGDLIRLPQSKIQRHSVVFLGRPISAVHLVGFVTKANGYGDCNIYTVDDGTGSIQCKFVFDESNYSSGGSVKLVDGCLTEGTLVHTTGRIIRQRGITMIVIKELSVLEDLHTEFNHVHYLDWLYKTKYKVGEDLKGRDRLLKLYLKPNFVDDCVQANEELVFHD